MFSNRSRYKSVPTIQARLPDGRVVACVQFPVRPVPRVLGYHQREDEQRLDHLANYYLKDPTRFWQLCDANDCPSPQALAARALIAIPAPER